MSTRTDGVKAWFAPRTWSFVAGAAAALALTLGTGWLTTSGAADSRATAATVNAYATICAQRAQAGPEAHQQLTALEALNSTYQRRDFVEEAGWAVMPNKAEADRDVIGACAAILAALPPPA